MLFCIMTLARKAAHNLEYYQPHNTLHDSDIFNKYQALEPCPAYWLLRLRLEACQRRQRSSIASGHLLLRKSRGGS